MPIRHYFVVHIFSLKAFEKELMDRFSVFLEDPTFHVLELEPMDKDDRYIVHDIVSSKCPHLNCVAVGDFDERRCVVFREGHRPADIDLPLGGSRGGVKASRAAGVCWLVPSWRDE